MLTKIIASIVIVVGLGFVAGCGEDVAQLRSDCVSQGGEISKVGQHVTCLKDGAIIAEWEEWE